MLRQCHSVQTPVGAGCPDQPRTGQDGDIVAVQVDNSEKQRETLWHPLPRRQRPPGHSKGILAGPKITGDRRADGDHATPPVIELFAPHKIHSRRVQLRGQIEFTGAVEKVNFETGCYEQEVLKASQRNRDGDRGIQVGDAQAVVT